MPLESLFNIYRETLITKKIYTVKNTGIRQYQLGMITYEQTKKGLSYSYWKRIVQEDGITTKPLNIWL